PAGGGGELRPPERLRHHPERRCALRQPAHGRDGPGAPGAAGPVRTGRGTAAPLGSAGWVPRGEGPPVPAPLGACPGWWATADGHPVPAPVVSGGPQAVGRTD